LGLKSKLKTILAKLILGNSTPNGIALGIAIGVFIGVLPLYGLHTVLVIIAALIVPPANKAAIFLGTSISLPPTVPFITWAGYEIGRLMFQGRFDPLSWSDFRNITFQKIADHYQPLFLGSLVLGVICALAAYLLTFFIVRNIINRRKHAAGI
jgi:uncharacterized protein (TIGR03546 family)